MTVMHSDAYTFLSSVYFFRNLGEDPLREMAAACEELFIPVGGIVFAEGESGDRFYMVISGKIELWKNFGEADRRILGEHSPGSMFGEMALVDSLSRSATARAVQPTRLFFLTKEQFERIVGKHPSVAMTVMRSLSYIIRNSNESFVADLNQRNIELEEAYKKLEEAQKRELVNERFSNLGKFSNMILHDLRNPVSVLNGYADILEAVSQDPNLVEEYARRIGLETRRLSHLAGELLDYTRGEIRINPTVVKPTELIDTTLAYVRDRAVARGIEWTIEIPEDQPVIIDRDRMVRVLVNLFDNARKACDRNGKIKISLIREGETMEICVSDDGEGMDEKTLNHIYEPFFSRSSSGGTGLGMVIVKNVVEAHGGELAVTSSPGAGTTVTIRMPSKVH